MSAALATALWLGLLTSISPCPLGTNLAAVSFIGRQVDDRRAAAWSALSYVLGRAVAYAGLGAGAVFGLLSVPALSQFLQRNMNQLLGPILILVGMALLDLLPIGFSTSAGSEALREKAAKRGPLGAFLLGVLFALSFCPVSAALFFGSLIPLSVQQGSAVALPVLYGVGTGLPVLGLAVLISSGASLLGATLERLDVFQLWARRVTGVIFVGVGLYYVAAYVFLI